jgi:hypothetical protein
MCVLDTLKRAVEQRDLSEIKRAVELFRFNGFSYQTIANLFSSHCDIEHDEYENIMNELDRL